MLSHPGPIPKMLSKSVSPHVYPLVILSFVKSKSNDPKTFPQSTFFPPFHLEKKPVRTKRTILCKHTIILKNVSSPSSRLLHSRKKLPCSSLSISSSPNPLILGRPFPRCFVLSPPTSLHLFKI